MERFRFEHSLKNIPIPNKWQYQKSLVSKVERFMGRMRWKLFAIQNPGTHVKNTYTNSAPQLERIKNV